MAKVLQMDQAGGASIEKDFGTNYSEVFVQADVALSVAGLADLLSNPGSVTGFELIDLNPSGGIGNAGVEWYVDSGPTIKWAAYTNHADPASTPHTPASPITSLQFYRVKIHLTVGAPIAMTISIDGVDIGAVGVTSTSQAHIKALDIFQFSDISPGSYVYFDTVKVGTTDGASDIFSDDFEGGDTSNWTSVGSGFTVVDDPGIAAAVPGGGGGGGGGGTVGRVFIAFDDGPLEPSPTWTCLDQGSPFPVGFVAGYEVTCGRQGLISQTDTGEATVDINDHGALALFDPRNVSSAYYGKLDGRQILLQLYDPVRAVWEPQFQGHIDNVLYDVDGSGVDQNGDPINVAIKLECVDIFDFLAGYGLTPGLDGITPRVVPSGSAGGAVPAGFEDGVFYAETVGSVDDRIIEILADVGIDSTRYHVSSGSVRVIAVKYDPDESALVALRDACDAEFPFIANMYVDRRGRFTFRGRGARFDPDGVSSEPGSTWDFTRWAVGDGNAIIADSSRAQMRILTYGRGRRDIINAALAYPQGIKPTDIPGQVFANTTSITAYGKHQAQPMSNLLTLNGTVTGNNANQETALYAELLVKNQKDPRESVASLQLKAIRPGDPRASATWAMITQADISHIVNVAVGYPGGTGFTGASPDDDYYIEGRRLQVTVANTSHDYVELDLEVSPAVWSMDTHAVFPPFPDSGAPAVLTADFTTPGIS